MDKNFTQRKEAYRGFTKTFELPVRITDYISLDLLRAKIADLLAVQGTNLKYSLGLHASFYKANDVTQATFKTKPHIYMRADPAEIPIEELQEELARWTHRGSNWILDIIDTFYVNTDVYNPLTGRGKVVLPKSLANKKCVVNIESNDGMCLMRAIMYALDPSKYSKDPQRQSKYKLDEKPELKEAVRRDNSVKGLKHIEKLIGKGIFLYGWEHNAPTFERQSAYKEHINLLLYNDHYMPITRLTALVKDSKDKNVYDLCEKCLQRFRQPTVPNHVCTQAKVRMTFPKNPMHKFDNIYRQQRHAHIAYVDTEATTIKCEQKITEKTMYTAEQKMVSYTIFTPGKPPESYIGHDAPRRMIERLEEMAAQLPTRVGPIDKGKCMCGRTTSLFSLSGTIGCMKCTEPSLFVYMHNFKGYDSHYLLEHASPKARIIAESSEKVKAIDWNNKLKFRDSMAFLAAALAVLAKTISKFPSIDAFSSNPQMAHSKGIFPYDWMDSIERLDEEMPKADAFVNTLSDVGPEAAKKLWLQASADYAKLGCKSMREYLLFYMETDTLLLADVFEQFRDSNLKNYGLDPAYYYSISNITWDALFKYTKQRVHLFRTDDEYRFIRKQIRGGTCHVGLRHAKANNPKTPGYDSSKPTTWLKYFDINNLYGGGMSFAVPHKLKGWDESWLQVPLEEALDRLMKLKEEAATGYIFEVDVDYPECLHELHNDYPLLPEKMCTAAYLGAQARDKVPKLVANLLNKKNYIVDYKMLQFALSQGLILRKIHRVMRTWQKPWMKPYIDLNTELRKVAAKGIEQDVPKLMNNAAYGKTCENIEQRLCYKICGEKAHKKLARSPRYRGSNILNPEKTLVSLTPKLLVGNKPSYIGAQVLDNSKLIMYRWWYDFWLPKFPKSKLVYTDTDSIIVLVEDPDIEASLLPYKDHFDTGNYPSDHPLFSPKNNKVIGKMKSETGEKVIYEVIAIRPKMYCVVTEDTTIKKAKGTKKSVIKKWDFTDYRKALKGITKDAEQTYLRSKNHKVFKMVLRKKTLAQHDTKRHEVGLDTLAIGHYRVARGEPFAVESDS